MLGNPGDKALEETVLYDIGVGNLALLHKIICAWGKVHTNSTKLGKKNCIAKEPYRQ